MVRSRRESGIYKHHIEFYGLAPNGLFTFTIEYSTYPLSVLHRQEMAVHQSELTTDEVLMLSETEILDDDSVCVCYGRYFHSLDKMESSHKVLS